jgi:hypothetical protein
MTPREVNYNNVESILMQRNLFLYQAEDHSYCIVVAVGTAVVVVAAV